MIVRYGDDRAPLELTKVSSRTRMVVCPNCKAGRYVSLNCVSVICSKCKTYFSVDESLDPSEALYNVDAAIIRPINKAFVKMKGEAEKKAYDWRDKQAEKRKKVGLQTHEPKE